MTRAGHTRIARTALRKTVEAVTAEAFRVSGRNVTAELDDDGGKLGVRVAVQLALPQLPSPQSDPRHGGNVFEQAQSARSRIVARGLQLTGMTFGRVDIRLTAGKPPHNQERRVR
ncbi:hypothetical protein ACPFL9_00835 [Paenarthrobacter sp. NyZ202]|uniref:hypothetical protein n=1 Tax=Paenarthrobacter sp. NyZ202 TaxID=3402689 RepID=UPI003CED2D30